MESPNAEEGSGPFRSLLFHDISHDPVDTLKGLIEVSKSSHTVKAILENCERGISIENASIDRHDRQRLPAFRTLQDLVHEAERQSAVNVLISMVTTVTAQLGCFGLLTEGDPSFLHQDGETHLNVVGLCAGAIAAATAAVATSQNDILRLSQVTAQIAYRVGLEADRRVRTLEQDQNSCTFALMGMPTNEAEEMLGEFHSRFGVPNHRIAYVSADLPGSITISGPSCTLDLLLSSKPWPADVKHKILPIAALFHAKHLACPNICRILAFPDLESFKLRKNVTFAPSQSSFEPLNDSLKAVLENVLTGLFQSRMVLPPSKAQATGRSWKESDQITSIEPCGSTKSSRKLLNIGEDIIHDITGAGNLNSARVNNVDGEVAVIGMAGRFPNADTLEEYWDIIVSGRSVHQQIPSGRFDAQASYDETASGKNTTASPFGCFMKQPGAFDHSFFNISPREAKQIDPQHRILLMVTQEALQMAGYSGAGNQRIGTFFGQATDDWRESHLRQDIDIFYVGAGMRAFAPGRLNYHYKWDGPSYSVDTACSASLAALELACKAVRSGDCDLAVAGGGNLCSALPMFSGLSKGRFTSSTGPCKTFCNSADGYCRGESVGVVAIQRLNDAVRENRSIKGTVAGIVTNHSAMATSITHPHAQTQETLMLSAIAESGLRPADIDYVEFHGTGTQAGDKTEIVSVSSVFDEGGSRSDPIHVGAVKANIGHCEAAAGITSLIKSLLMIRYDTIPPHCGIKDQLSLAVKQAMSDDLSIPDQALSFRSKSGPKNILINNFNATGGNTCMVLREPPQDLLRKESDPRSHLPFTVSGQTSKALLGNLARFQDYLKTEKSIEMPDVSYSCTAKRVHYKYRKSFTASSLEELTAAVEQELADSKTTVPKTTPRTAFVFAGQGTQTQGIAAELYETCPSFKSILEDIGSLCSNMGYPPFIPFLVERRNETEWNSVQLQLATVAIELSLARLWQSWGVEPSFVIGHSLGEYAALCVSGVISEADLFSLVGKRAQLMEELCEAGTHTMLSVQCSPDRILDLKSNGEFDECEISCYNSAQAVTMSGPGSQFEKMQERLSEQNIKSTFLKTKYAFHSANIEPILEQYKDCAESIPFCAPKVPVISTLLGEEVTEIGVFGAQYLADQARNPVRFFEALQCSSFSTKQRDSQGTVWIEFGPGNPACLSFVRSTIDTKDRTESLSCLSTRGQTWQNVSQNLSRCFECGLDVDWASFHKDHEGSLKLLDMPTYAFDLQDFWIPLEGDGAPQTFQEREKLTPMLHMLDRYSSDSKGVVAEFQSQLSDDHLFDMIQGHFVMGTPLCPSSVYCAMAIGAASFLEKKESSERPLNLAWRLGEMNIQQPLLATKRDGLSIKVTASRTLGDDSVTVDFATLVNGKPSQEHGNCSLSNDNSDNWMSDWSKVSFFVKSRMEQIEASQSDDIIRLPRSVLYKLFSNVVAYAKPFQGIKTISMDQSTNEAIAEVQFDAFPDADPEYDVHVIDSLMHFAGFVLNNGIEDDEHVFISDGWDSLKILPGIKRADKHRYYVRLAADCADQVYSGDIYAFSGSQIVAYCGGVRFRKMRKHSLEKILRQHSRSEQEFTADGSGGTLKKDDETRVGTPNSSTLSPEDAEAQLKRILAAEAGTKEDKINEATGIAELGFDSILMMSLLDKIEQKLNVTIPSQEATAARNFGDLKAALLSRCDQESASVSQPSQPTQDVLTSAVTKIVNEQSTSKSSDKADLISTIVQTIAKHTGVSEEQVDQAENFGHLGVDSLLSLDIIDSVHKKTGKELPTSFLQENCSVKRLRSTSSTHLATDSRRSSFATSGSNTPVYEGSNSSPEPSSDFGKPLKTGESAFQKDVPIHSWRIEAQGGKEIRECKVRLIQGSRQSRAIPLFFLPPGDGTASIYSKLPMHPENIPIYSPESPFAADPEHSDNTFANVSGAYKSAVQKTFPSGPYRIAGYSVGGAYAFEVTRLLLEEGCEVSNLVIVDCPAPTPPLEKGIWFGMEAMIMVGFADHLRSLLPTLTTALLEHTAAATREFNRYVAKPFGKNIPGQVSITWSTHGSQAEFIQRCVAEQLLLNSTAACMQAKLIEERRKAADMSWCYNKRTDLGPQGWDEWLGPNVRYDVIDGNHFSIAVDPAMKLTAERIYQGLQ